MVPKNVVKKDKTLLKYVVLCLLFAFICTCVILISGRAFEYKTSKSDIGEALALRPGETVTQKIETPAEEIRGLSIVFMTFGRVNTGRINVALCDDGVPVCEKSIEASYIVENSYNDFRFGRSIHVNKGHQYSFQITYDSDNPDDKIALITSCSGNGLDQAGTVIQDRTLCYQLILVNNGMRIAAVIVFLLAALAGSVLVVKKNGIAEIKISKAVIGSLIVVLILEFVSVDLLSKTRLDVLTDISEETGTSATVEPGESIEYPFEITFSPAGKLNFALVQGDYDNINVELVNSDSGYVYLERNLVPDEFIQEYSSGRNAMMITAACCGIKEFPLGHYSIKVTNTSSDTPLVLETTKNAEGETELFVIQSKFTWMSRIMACVMLLTVSVYLYLVFIFTHKKPVKAEFMFLLTAIPLGAIYFALFQPWSVSDTTAHFEAVYRISNNFLGCNDNNGWMMRSADNVFYKNVWHFAPSYPCTRSMLGVYDNFFASTGSGTNMVPISDPLEQMEYYTVISYFPMVLGLVIGRLLNLGIVPALYLARLFMWAFYIVVCYRAIRITPVGKMVFSTVCLLPMSLVMSNSISYDALVIVSTMYFIASVLRLRKDASIRNMIETCIPGFLIGGVKGGGYLLLLILVFILWDKKEKEKSIKKILALAATALFAFVLFNMLIPRVKLYQFGSEGSDKLSTMWGITHPLEYINMSIASYLDYADKLIVNIGGTFLSWEEFTIDNIVIIALMITALIAAVFEKDEIVLNKRDKIVFICTILISVAFTPLMLLSWTDPGSPRVEGLQGRYYLPVLPLIILLMSKYGFKKATLEADNDNSLAVLKTCQKVFAVISVLCVYFMMRRYLIR